MRLSSKWWKLGILLYVVGIGVADVASAKAPWLKKAKELGYPAENCLYCHTEKLPKKEHAKDQINDRGKWLQSQKDSKKATEVDVDWLKDYPGGKEQK